MDVFTKLKSRRNSAEIPVSCLLSPVNHKAAEKVGQKLSQQRIIFTSNKDSVGIVRCYNVTPEPQLFHKPVLKQPAGLYSAEQWRPVGSWKFNQLGRMKSRSSLFPIPSHKRRKTATRAIKSRRSASLVDEELLCGKSSVNPGKIPFAESKKMLRGLLDKCPQKLDECKVRRIKLALQMKMNLGEMLTEKVVTRADIISLQLRLGDKERYKFLNQNKPVTALLSAKHQIGTKPSEKLEAQMKAWRLAKQTNVDEENNALIKEEATWSKKFTRALDEQRKVREALESNVAEQNPNFRDLLYSIKEDNVEKVKALLSQNSKLIHEKDTVGSTALHVACRRGSVDIITELVKCGADLRSKDLLKRTPKDIATKHGKDSVLFVLSNL